MSEQLKHIFDSSACLSKRQLKDYAAGLMSREECYAAEHHITNCFFCSEALDGLLASKGDLAAVEELNSNFLKDHFSLTSPQIHLNSIAPAVSAQPGPRRISARDKVQPLLKPSSIAAALLLGFGVLWYLNYNKENNLQPRQVVQQAEASGPVRNTVAGAQAAAELPPATTAQTPSPTEAAAQQPQGPAGGGDQQQKPQALVATDPHMNGSNARAADLSAQGDTDAAMATKALTVKKDENVIPAPPPAEKIEKMAFRSQTETADHKVPAAPPKAAVSGATVAARSANAELMQEEREDAREERAAADEAIASADEMFEAGKYSSALSTYKKQMSSSGNRAQQYAALQAARCHIQLGNKAAASRLLQSLMDNGNGSSKRQAKRLMKELEGTAE